MEWLLDYWQRNTVQGRILWISFSEGLTIWGYLVLFFFFNYLFWLHQVLVGACRIFVVVGGLISSCGSPTCCPMACGILGPRPGIEPMSPALQGRFLTTGPPGKSCCGWMFLTEEYKIARLPPPPPLQSLDSSGARTPCHHVGKGGSYPYVLNNMVLLPGWPCYPHNQVLSQSAKVLNPQPRMGYKLSGATFHHGGGSKWRRIRRGNGATLWLRW